MAYHVQSREDEIQTLNFELQSLLSTKEEDLKSAIKELSDAQEQLFKSEKAKALQGLVSGITHEINTPLGIAITLSSHLEVLINDLYKADKTTLQFKEDFDEIFEMLNKNLNYLAQLIISFKRIAVNQERENIDLFKLNEYIEDVFLVHKSSLKKHRISLDSHLQDITINSYPDLFGKIISILITNCIDHAFLSGSSQKVMRIEVFITNQTLHIDYCDNGQGIPDKLIPIIFDPFITTNRNEGNTGLGMSILNNIVLEYFKGTINIFNTKPGLTIEISIPIKSFEDSTSIYETMNLEQYHS
jgi:signal transduction histidine kinase